MQERWSGGVIKSCLSISWEATVIAPDWMVKRPRPTNKAGVLGLLEKARLFADFPSISMFWKGDDEFRTEAGGITSSTTDGLDYCLQWEK